VARAATEMASGGSTCSLTTVQWGTTHLAHPGEYGPKGN
jgi:hypothetical protein